MYDTQRMLEAAGDRFDMPEPAMDRLLCRRERKERKERIAAAAVGLGVAAIGIVGALLTLRVTEGTTPASGPGVEAAAEGGGFVLPTVAIWTAIVVLGLTVLAAVRLRARFADADMDVEQEGRAPGGAAAPARRPAVDPGAAPRGGGGEMDSRSKTEVTRIPGAKMPEIRFDDGKLRRTNRWLIGAVVVLALALIAVSTWAVVDRSGGEEGLADPATVALVDDFLAAHNAMNQTNVATTVADWYMEDAVLYHPWIPAGYEVFARNEGRTRIQRFYDWLLDQSYGNVAVERISSVVQTGNLVTFLVRDVNGLDHAWSILFSDGKIAEHFVALPDQ